MVQIKKNLFFAAMLLWTMLPSQAQEGSLSPLHVDGRFLVTAEGERVILHGFCQTYSPWFNEQGTQWTNYNVPACLKYNKGIIDGILNAGWEMTFVRMHMDPYWSNMPGQAVENEADISAFNFERFKKYLNEVFIPMAEYAVSKGLYVVMRPPGVCPEHISPGDEYQKYLLQVWEHVAQQEKLKGNLCIMYELANEPINIYNANGSLAGFKELRDYFQPIVDVIRKYADNIVLVPGTAWQARYAGFADYPVEGTNVGYAVHCYPGWYNGGYGDGDVTVNYGSFKQGWDEQIWPVASFSPIVVTEMDWAPEKYQSSWGKSNTGVAGGTGFGANFKRIADETGNVSWVIFTDGDKLAKYDDSAPDGNTFLTDPEACPRPCYRWYKEYATQEYRDMINDPEYGKPQAGSSEQFPLTNAGFNPSIWETGTFDEATGKLHTGQYGFGGWKYAGGLDISEYKYLVAELAAAQTCGASFRLFDMDDYWSKPYMADFGSGTRVCIDLHAMKNEEGRTLDPSHIYIAGFWTSGSAPIYISRVFLSNDGQTPAAIISTAGETAAPLSREYFTIDGRAVTDPAHGLYIVRERMTDGTTRQRKVVMR